MNPAFSTCWDHPDQNNSKEEIMPLLKLALFTFLFFIGLVTFFLLCLPHKLVEWQASYTRRHLKSHRKMSDEEIDSIPYLDPFATKPLSRFLEIAPREPGRYPRLIRAHRAIGIGMFLIWSLIVAGILCSILQGNSI